MERAGRRRGWTRRALCRLRIHTYRRIRRQERGDEAADPCLYDWRCTTCDRLERSAVLHQHGRERATDPACHKVAACDRCGHEVSWERHLHRLVAVGELPPDQQPSGVRDVRDPGPCDFAQICRHCDEMDSSVLTEHDWDTPWWGGRCRRCWVRWIDDGD